MQTVAGFLNGILWSTPLPILCLVAGLVFTIVLKGVQIRKIPEQLKLLFNGKASDRGLSSFQAFTLAIAGRVGTGNIAGVATALCIGGPGAIFWMWTVAILGAATSFIECTMSQLYKEEINGEYRGGAAYYLRKGVNKYLGFFFAIIFIIAEVVCLTGIQSNAISSAVSNAFHVPPMVTGAFIIVTLGAIIFGGAKRLGRVAEVIVPFMAIIYCIVGLIVLAVNITELPGVFALIVKSAFGAGPALGGIIGSAVMMGVKRGVYSNEAGMSTATPSAASAEVSHPVKQGLVQSFSVYIDTIFVCTATAMMLLVTDCYNVISGDVTYIENAAVQGIEAGPVWVQTAISTVFPFGNEFVAIALFFFAFTTLMSMYYNAETSLMMFFEKRPELTKTVKNVLRVIYLICTFYGTATTSAAAWDFGDVGIGMMTWVNVVCLFLFLKTAKTLLKDYEDQKKQGLDPVFDSKKYNIPGTELWESIKEGYDKGKLHN